MKRQLCCNYVVGVRISPDNGHPCSRSESSIHPEHGISNYITVYSIHVCIIFNRPTENYSFTWDKNYVVVSLIAMLYWHYTNARFVLKIWNPLLRFVGSYVAYVSSRDWFCNNRCVRFHAAPALPAARLTWSTNGILSFKAAVCRRRRCCMKSNTPINSNSPILGKYDFE